MAKRRYNITAIITDKRGRPLSIANNDYKKSHPMMRQLGEAVGEPYKIALHAEVSAILRCHDLSKAHKISIFRYDKDGNPRLAKPCKVCMRAINLSGIPNVEWTTNEI